MMKRKGYIVLRYRRRWRWRSRSSPRCCGCFDERQHHRGPHPRPAGVAPAAVGLQPLWPSAVAGPGEPGRCFFPRWATACWWPPGDAGVVVAGDPRRLQLFALSRRDGWLYAGLGIYMVPPVAFVLPLYFILEHFGLLNTRSGLVLVYCSLIVPFLTWMVKTSSIPCRRISNRRPA